MTTLAVFACAGLLLQLIGRWLLMREDRALSSGWRVALLAVPLADVVYLAGSWPRGKVGGSIALAGLVALTPVVGELALQTSLPANGAGLRGQVANVLMRQKTDTPEERRAEAARIREHKVAKIEALRAYLERWHESLQARRAAFIRNGADDLSKFDAEATAYHSLNAVAKEELRGLASLSITSP